MTLQFQACMLVGALALLAIIFVFLKKGLMTVKYSLLWLGLSIVLVIFAACPYVVYVLRDLLDVEMPVNLVFLLMFCFVLVVLLSLSIAISQLAEKCRRTDPRPTPSWKNVSATWKTGCHPNNATVSRCLRFPLRDSCFFICRPTKP